MGRREICKIAVVGSDKGRRPTPSVLSPSEKLSVGSSLSGKSSSFHSFLGRNTIILVVKPLTFLILLPVVRGARHKAATLSSWDGGKEVPWTKHAPFLPNLK